MESKTGNKKIDHHCGNCIFFKFEDTDGDGNCVKHYWDIDKEGEDPMLTNCSNESCPDFISKEDMLYAYKRLLEMEYLFQRKFQLTYAASIRLAIIYIKAFNKL